jgi:hypothetical protein
MQGKEQQPVSYFWDDMTDAECSEWFEHFTPEEFLAALAKQEELYGIPADYKVTDPRKLAQVAKLMVGSA